MNSFSRGVFGDPAPPQLCFGRLARCTLAIGHSGIGTGDEMLGAWDNVRFREGVLEFEGVVLWFHFGGVVGRLKSIKIQI